MLLRIKPFLKTAYYFGRWLDQATAYLSGGERSSSDRAGLVTAGQLELIFKTVFIVLPLSELPEVLLDRRARVKS
jgi:hypothetical protein